MKYDPMSAVKEQKKKEKQNRLLKTEQKKLEENTMVLDTQADNFDSNQMSFISNLSSIPHLQNLPKLNQSMC